MEPHVIPTAVRVPGSKAQIIYRAFSSGEISQESTDGHLAFLIADTVSDHAPVSYPPPSAMLQHYLSARAAGIESRDQTLAIKNGEWIQLVARIRSRNITDYELLMWAGRICKRLRAPERCAVLREAVMRHVRAHDECPWDVLDKAVTVQRTDSIECQRGGG